MSILYIVATPIGNLADASSRLSQVLDDVDVIAAEDTRRTGLLLQHLGISKKQIAFHAHNEHRHEDEVIALLESGQKIALVSDAGTPLIADPGFSLVKRCLASGIDVVPVPGPSSITTALSVAGLPTTRFSFEGFVPAKPAARKRFYQALAGESHTLVCFEVPHRIEASLSDLASQMGESRRVCICRELTKTYEQIVQGEAAALTEAVRSGEIPAKGEFVIVIEGGEASAQSREVDEVLTALLEELAPSRAATVAARLTGRKKSELYERAIELAQTDT
jgi:16S rRNA (cytidine1402-2'-O)-methyltransferase